MKELDRGESATILDRKKKLYSKVDNQGNKGREIKRNGDRAQVGRRCVGYNSEGIKRNGRKCNQVVLLSVMGGGT